MATTYVFICVEVERDGGFPVSRHTKGMDDNHTAYSINEGPGKIASVSNLIKTVGAGNAPGKVYCWATDDTSVTKPEGQVVVGSYAAATGNYIRFSWGANTLDLTEGTDFTAETSNTVTGDNLATAINDHPLLGRFLTAVNASGTVTITCDIPGRQMDPLAISTDDATAFTTTDDIGNTTAGTTGTSPIVFYRRVDRSS